MLVSLRRLNNFILYKTNNNKNKFYIISWFFGVFLFLLIFFKALSVAFTKFGLLFNKKLLL